MVRLQFIRHCLKHEMALDEVRMLLQYRDTTNEDCGYVNALLDEHIHAVEMRVEELMQLKRHLIVLRQKCASTAPTASCGILQALGDHSCHVSKMPARPQSMRYKKIGRASRRERGCQYV